MNKNLLFVKSLAVFIVLLAIFDMSKTVDTPWSFFKTFQWLLNRHDKFQQVILN